ncbi:MAG: acetyl-CoA carboxylase biotin carboxyl carrier protein subunit [Desulfobacterales bacterium]|nr:acetyl-CoA carboxylase biotin carboxyl carrier protein subunit [Desulfobacterales bacterium]
MEYHLEANEEAVTVDLETVSDNQARVKIDGTGYDLGFQRISDAGIQLRVNGRQINAWVEKGREGKTVVLNGRRYFILDRDEQGRSHTPGKPGAGDMPTAVTPPMPAIVIQVAVSEGDPVEKGDTVVVVSAMKMETSLKAPYSGKITRIGVAEGDKVMPGDILADIEKQTDEETA